jgi:L-iditol 2-dehydrogenase
MMQAAVITAPGTIEVQNVATPEPAAGEVLLKVCKSALCGTDQRVLRGEKNVDVPIIGHELTGEVVSVGDGVTGVNPGERYAVQTVIGCNECPMCKQDRQNLCEKGFRAIGYAWNGGFAEYMIMPREAVEQGCLIPIPEGLSDAEGTLLEPLSCCINGMRYFPPEEMHHVVIMSAGIIGVLCGLVARANGAKTVTMMNRSQGRLDLIKKLGLPFDNLINTSETDPEAWVKEYTDGHGVNGVVVAASAKELVPVGLRLLAFNGHLSVFAGMSKQDPVEPIDLNIIHYRELHIHGANSSVRRDYEEARELLVSGKIDGKALVTHEFPLADFNAAFQTQADAETPSLKILIQP